MPEFNPPINRYPELAQEVIRMNMQNAPLTPTTIILESLSKALGAYFSEAMQEQKHKRAIKEDVAKESRKFEQEKELAQIKAQQELPTPVEQEFVEKEMKAPVGSLKGVRSEFLRSALSARTQAAKTEAKEEKENLLRNSQIEQGLRVMNTVDEAMKKVTPFTTGIGSYLASVPATKAKNLAADLQMIKSNLGFAELSAMRQASPTGGALGQVSDREIALLQSTVQSLDQAQSDAQLKDRLAKVKQHYANWLKTLGWKGEKEPPPPPGGPSDDIDKLIDSYLPKAQ